ncbi:hypothetical protein [Pseudomonas baltica]|uniref:hypothetical protein n=1 Tax=Pseudomonas baltica TaxID=2762576 RepID=UPI00289D8B71|nr:hypothetical protein [Pseudomonas baltica]
MVKKNLLSVEVTNEVPLLERLDQCARLQSEALLALDDFRNSIGVEGAEEVNRLQYDAKMKLEDVIAYSATVWVDYVDPDVAAEA